MKSEFWINFKIFAKLKTLKKCCNTADNLELCDFEEPTTTTTTKATTTTTLSTTVTMTTSTKKTTTTTTTTTMITNDESSTTPTTTTSTTTEACEETFRNLDKMLSIFKPLTFFWKWKEDYPVNWRGARFGRTKRQLQSKNSQNMLLILLEKNLPKALISIF